MSCARPAAHPTPALAERAPASRPEDPVITTRRLEASVNDYGKMLLRCSGGRSRRRARGDGVLPLFVMPFLVCRAGQRIHLVEAGECEDHERRRPGREL